MAVKSCRVTVTELEGVSHTVQLTASTLYEAIALGLAAVRGDEWVAGIPQGVATVRVSVTSLPVEHAVKVRDFTSWLERLLTAGEVKWRVPVCWACRFG